MFYGFILSLLNRNLPVRANNFRRRHFAVPIIAFCYSIPLCYCSVIFNARKPRARRKGIITNFCNTVADCHVRKACAIIEGILADARHAVGDGNGCKFRTALKAERPMFVTLLPIITLVRTLHQEKASSPILVTVFGIVILIIFLLLKA